MVLNLKQNILTLDGKPAQQKYGNNENNEVIEMKEMTLGLVIRDCVLLEGTEVKTITQEEHLMRYGIFEKTFGDEMELSEEEVSFVKILAARRYMPLYAGQILRMLSK